MTSMLIKDGYVVTPRDEGILIIKNGAVAIEEDRIVAVGRSDEVSGNYACDIVLDGTQHIIMPGLIDAHIHSSLSLLRGLAQDVPEKEWMHKTVDPLTRYYTKETSLIGSKLCILEAIKSGTTCFCDYGSWMDEFAEKIYRASGVRANICSTINETGIGKRETDQLYEFDTDIGEQKLNAGVELVEKWHGKANGRITCLFGPQAADMMSKEMLLRIRELAIEHELQIHMHIAQGGRERNQMKMRYGKSTIEFLKEIDYLHSNLIAVHCHDANLDELRTLADNQVKLVGCPGSIGLIDGMVPPLQDYLNFGGTTGLGSDQSPPDGNNMFTQMRYAALLNKIKHRDPTALPAWQALRLATIASARCHGLGDRIGSLEVGKKADVILVNLNKPHLTPTVFKPIRNLVPNLVYQAHGTEVTTVIVDGKIVMENRCIKTMNEEKVLRDAQKAAEELTAKAESDYLYANSYLVDMVNKGKM